MSPALSFESRLQALLQAGERLRQCDGESPHDRAEELPAERRQAWASFLCSIATTESIETLILEPIHGAFAESPEARRFLEMQGGDERRHHALLTAYVKRTFGYEKRRRSGSDVLIYGTLLPAFSRLARRKPLYLMTALRFYEAFSLQFYKVLKRLAQADGLSGLVALIQAIEKDEAIHLAGLEALVREHQRARGAPGRGDLMVIRSVLQLLLFDIDIRPQAVHNRRVRRNALAIGIDPLVMCRDAKAAASDAVRFASGSVRAR